MASCLCSSALNDVLPLNLCSPGSYFGSTIGNALLVPLKGTADTIVLVDHSNAPAHACYTYFCDVPILTAMCSGRFAAKVRLELLF